MLFNAMTIMIKFVACVIGLLIYTVVRVDSRNADPNLKNTLSEDEQNIGDTCLANMQFTCNPTYKYRIINGGCTNLKFPSRGISGSIYSRLMPALYQDNVSVIRTQKSGKELNSARVLSNIFFTDLKDERSYDKEFTLSLMQWSQIMTHDISGTAGKTGPSCCTMNSQRLETTTDNCVGIKVPTGDRFYSNFNKTCINLKRTRNNIDANCNNIGPILPINFVTSFIDGSLLYGSTLEANNIIRLFQKGLMKYQEIEGNIFPPNVNDPHTMCRVTTNEDLCIQAGDSRSNAHPMLAVMQTILLRLHNIIANELRKLNPDWDDETVFQEARRLVIAIIQHITYKYFLPILLGIEYLQKVGCCLVKDESYNNIYDEMINPQILTEFSGAVFRSLHSAIVHTVIMYDESRKPTQQWNFSDFYLSVGFIAKENNFEQLVIGMTNNPQGNIDRHFPTDITDLLFNFNGVGADLESIDIEKGRDLGINTYPRYLEMIGNPYPKSWDDYNNYMPNNMVERLKLRYESYEDVELFLGGILEYDAPGSPLGPVFQAICTEQFGRLQKADRFWYESGDQPYPFTEDQLKQIRKITLSLIYCYTCPKLQNMQPDAFRLPNENNQLKSCKEIIGDFTLDPWKQK